MLILDQLVVKPHVKYQQFRSSGKMCRVLTRPLIDREEAAKRRLLVLCVNMKVSLPNVILKNLKSDFECVTISYDVWFTPGGGGVLQCTMIIRESRL